MALTNLHGALSIYVANGIGPGEVQSFVHSGGDPEVTGALILFIPRVDLTFGGAGLVIENVRYSKTDGDNLTFFDIRGDPGAFSYEVYVYWSAPPS